MGSKEEDEGEPTSPENPTGGNEEDESRRRVFAEGFYSGEWNVNDYDDDITNHQQEYSKNGNHDDYDRQDGYDDPHPFPLEDLRSNQENYGGGRDRCYDEELNETLVHLPEEEVMPPNDSAGEEEVKSSGVGVSDQGDYVSSGSGDTEWSTEEDCGGSGGGGSPYHYYDREPEYDFFERVYHCYPLSSVEKSGMETGNKIIMPEEALMILMETRITMPMMFEIQNIAAGRISHCGVFEFTGRDTEGIFLPEWMMTNLQLGEGDSVTLRSTSLARGTKIKLQPHTMDFLEIRNPKAVLEHNLQTFCCLTAGDTIMITRGMKKFYINVVETEPEHAICIIDTDCEVDFAPPLDYKEPEKPAMKKNKKLEPSSQEMSKFIPFTGKSYRLGGGALKQEELNQHQLEPSSHGVEEQEKLKFIPFTGKSYHLGGGAWKQDEWNQHSLEPSSHGMEEHKKSKFIPFTGKSYRLGGDAWKQEEWNQHPKFVGLNEEPSTMPPEEQEMLPKQGKFTPFTGLFRRLDEPEPSV